jgi:transaldolase/glucose-6-phosphate isomerase
MKYNPILKLSEFGQSIWLDYLRRDMLESGELRGLIENDGLRGMTSNPAIFWKAIDGSDDYTKSIRALSEEGKNEKEIYRILTVEDVQKAADIFRPVYDKLDGADGFVSLEVNPHLARDVDGTIKEARELWKELDRPNALIKVPATGEGLTCIRKLISEGININVTLLFGLDRYREVADAYISGLEDRINKGESIKGINSVASFFLSRIDVKVDPQLENLMKEGDIAESIHGEVALASAKLAYQIYKEMFNSKRFEKLVQEGARPQRVLWASTSTKNPDYSDIKYVEPLIGPETINTVPQETLNAYRNHGNPEIRLEKDIDKARSVLGNLKQLGIDIDEVTAKLIEEGIEKFNKPYDETMESLKKRIEETKGKSIDSQEMLLGNYKDAVDSRIQDLTGADFSKRLWSGDAALWDGHKETQKQIRNSLGWLYVAEKMISAVPDLKIFQSDIRKAGFRHAVHLGMGGSSLAPLVFQQTLPAGTDGLPLKVLDTTDPQTILKISEEIPVDDTIFIVASKSGTTTETITFMEYFYDRVKKNKADRAGENFVAITDPGSPLVETAVKRGFRKVFLNFADIGGRYSAMSYFGIVPAVLMGIDIEELLEHAVRMAYANQHNQSGALNTAIILGAAIGELARQGRDKLTFLTSESLSSLGLWLEQLIAESTGKEGRGILPVAGEDIAEPGVYGNDRVFVYFELQDEKYDKALKQVKRLAEAGHPVIIIRLQDRYDIGQEMMRWEIATATAGAVLKINPFNQPNVQESKDNTNRLLKTLVEKGSLPSLGSSDNVDGKEISIDNQEIPVENELSKFLGEIGDKGYIAIQAYLTENPETDRILQEIRHDFRNRYGIATTLGYGPRYLHSTGQYHKGGPNNGLFIQLVAERTRDTDIPGKSYSFGALFDAQAQGDFEALRKHGQRAIRIRLGIDVINGLNRIKESIAEMGAVRSD